MTVENKIELKGKENDPDYVDSILQGKDNASAAMFIKDNDELDH